MKLTKLVLAAGVIALLGAGCANNSMTNANTAPAPGTSRAVPASGSFTVSITSDGEFSPTTAFVKKGSIISFVNNSNKSHSIMPNTDAGKKFDALNSKTNIPPGGKFTVTMNETGRWLYYDGINPAFGGAVDVSE